MLSTDKNASISDSFRASSIAVGDCLRKAGLSLLCLVAFAKQALVISDGRPSTHAWDHHMPQSPMLCRKIIPTLRPHKLPAPSSCNSRTIGIPDFTLI